MKRKLLVASAFVPALAFLALAAEAHHGWGGYDTASTMKMTGTVRQMNFDNPHALLRLEADGKQWNIVLAPPSRMTARGLPDGSIKAGDSVGVEGYVAKSEPDEIRAERIQVAGKSVELR